MFQARFVPFVVAFVSLISFAAIVQAEVAVFDVPRLDKISIDGDGADWGDQGFRVDALTDTTTRIAPATEFDANFRLGWDDRGLLILLNARQDVFVEEPVLENIWQRDSVELFVGRGVGKPGQWQAVISPGMSNGFPDMRFQTYDQREPNDRPAALKFEGKRTRVDGGYMLEALLPWDNLGIKPAVGETCAFQIYINRTSVRTKHQASWFPKVPGPPGNPRLMYTLRLADKPGEPIRVAAWGQYERFRRTRVNILATADLAGKSVEVREGISSDQGNTPVSGKSTLLADGRRATAAVLLPMPPPGKPYGPLTVSVDGRQITTIDLPDVEDQRKEQFVGEQVTFKPAIFTGEKFPPYDFDEPAHAEDLIGSYDLSATFYDADYKQVDHATRPGRYGAVIEIKTDAGQLYHKFTTLFHVAGPTNLNAVNVDLTLPTELGIDPEVVKNQRQSINDLYKMDFSTGGEHSSNRAIMLAGLFETKPTDPAGTRITDFNAKDRDWWFGLKKKLDLLPHMSYLAYTPAGYDDDAQKKWPTLIYLHGSGSQGEDTRKLLTVAFPGEMQQKKLKPPMVVLIPQAPRGEWWTPKLLDVFLDEMETKYRIDPDRIYLTGTSMGGIGTYDWANENPGRFAAIAPVCGRGDVADAAKIKDLPIWAFHGDQDHNVPIEPDQLMFKKMQEIGGRMRLTVFVGGGHGIDWAAYATPDLFDWMLGQKRGQPSQAPATQPSMVPFK